MAQRQLVRSREHRVIAMITPEWMQFEWSAATKFPFRDDFGAWHTG